MAMQVAFLISAHAFQRLHAAAHDRGWRSDPDYAERTVQRFAARGELDIDALAQLAAMSGDFAAADAAEAAAQIGRFFGERPRRLEIAGAEYAVDVTLGRPRPA
jgi:hypothetical protein